MLNHGARVKQKGKYNSPTGTPPPRRGGPPGRPVIDPQGNRYPSLTAAAQALQVPVSTIHGRLVLPARSGWRYADQDTPAPASPTEQR